MKAALPPPDRPIAAIASLIALAVRVRLARNDDVLNPQ